MEESLVGETFINIINGCPLMLRCACESGLINKEICQKALAKISEYQTVSMGQCAEIFSLFLEMDLDYDSIKIYVDRVFRVGRHDKSPSFIDFALILLEKYPELLEPHILLYCKNVDFFNQHLYEMFTKYDNEKINNYLNTIPGPKLRTAICNLWIKSDLDNHEYMMLKCMESDIDDENVEVFLNRFADFPEEKQKKFVFSSFTIQRKVRGNAVKTILSKKIFNFNFNESLIMFRNAISSGSVSSIDWSFFDENVQEYFRLYVKHKMPYPCNLYTDKDFSLTEINSDSFLENESCKYVMEYVNILIKMEKN